MAGRAVNPIDWAAVERAIRKGVHGPLSDTEQKLVERTHRRAPSRYAALHRKCKADEIEQKKRMWAR